jgi:hypothetical protein
MPPSIRSFCFAALLTAGCAASPDAPGEVASATLELSSPPPSVQCLVVNASVSGHSETWAFALTGPSTPPLVLDDVPVGKTKFDAAAYAGACQGDAAPAEAPTWVSTPTFFDILAGRDNHISLLLHPPGGSVDGDVSFQVPVVEVSAGEITTVALLANGQVWGWGVGTDGQLGTDNKTRLKPFLVPGVPPMAHLAAGRSHVCGITRDDGQVYCWGKGSNGQLGVGLVNGNPPAKLGPTKVNLDLPDGGGNIIPGVAFAIAAGETHTCVLLRNGNAGARMTCWGSGVQTNPAVMLASPAQPLQSEALTTGGYVDVRASNSQYCVLTGFGPVRCGAFPTGPQTTPPSLNLIAIDEGQNALVDFDVASGTRYGVRADGQVATWSKSGTTVSAATLVPGITDAVQVSAAGTLQGVQPGVSFVSKPHVCVLRSGGGIKCWGADAKQGQLGDGSGEGSAIPVTVRGPDGVGSFNDAVFVAAGRARSCAITEDGALYCWGENVAGMLGQGDHVSRYVATRVVF